MKQKTNFIKHIQLWGIALIVGVAVIITAIDIIGSCRDFNYRSEKLRANYIAGQKQNIKQEVERVVELISYEKSQSELLTRKKIKSRVNDAFSIAQNIYQQNKSTKSKDEIQKIILDALRPIHFADDKGYYFATRLDGVEILFADKPEMEGLNLLNVQDTQGKYVIKDMIEIVKQSNEGFYEYYWTKPQATGNNFKKISFIKLFEPLDWFIGAGLYVEDMEKMIQTDLLETIGRIRFGPENNGYIFVVSFEGTTLMNGTQKHLIGKNIWNLTDPNGVKVIQQERKAAENPQGGFIYYTWNKPTSEKPSPKTSFIKGVKDWEWIIGAGVYLDDVEKDISLLQTELNNQIKTKILTSLLISIAVLSSFLFIFNRVNRKLKNDINLFISFFKYATFSNKPIDRSRVHFNELDHMAKNANKMLEDKIQAEKALLASEKRFKDLAENSTDWIWEFDENEIFTYSSPRVKELLGYSPEELIGQSAFDPMSSPESEKIMKEFLKFKEARKPFSCLRNTNQHKNGKTVIIESSGVPIIDKEGNFHGYRGIDRDITDRINLEDQIRQAHKMEAIGTLAGGIAHDFNNILAAVLGYADLAMDNIPDHNPAKVQIAQVLKAGNRAKELVKHILSFSRKEADKQSPVTIYLIVKEALKLLRASIPTTIIIKQDIDPQCGTILANPTQIHQVIMNLCTNAAQSLDETGGIVEVKLVAVQLSENDLQHEPGLNPGPYVQLSVQDNGKGIEQKYLNRIFDPYFTTKEVGKGSGMGLAVVIGIVKSHGGMITVDSKPGVKTTFTVYFPSIEEQIQEEIKENTPLPTGKERILVVDDETSMVDLTKQRVERLGYQVTVKTSSIEALELFRSQPDSFDLVITDQTMPQLTGEQLAKELLKIKPNIPIIICTGYSSKIDAEKADFIGISAFIMKPVAPKELAKAIRNTLDNKTGERLTAKRDLS